MFLAMYKKAQKSAESWNFCMKSDLSKTFRLQPKRKLLLIEARVWHGTSLWNNAEHFHVVEGHFIKNFLRRTMGWPKMWLCCGFCSAFTTRKTRARCQQILGLLAPTSPAL